MNIKKKEKGPYWPRLTKNAVKYPWLNLDWGRYIDEDEEDELNNDLKGDFNPMNMMGGGMGGMPGMGGPGMGGLDDMGEYGGEDEDDGAEDQKHTEHKHSDNCKHEPENSEKS